MLSKKIPYGVFLKIVIMRDKTLMIIFYDYTKSCRVYVIQWIKINAYKFFPPLVEYTEWKSDKKILTDKRCLDKTINLLLQTVVCEF